MSDTQDTLIERLNRGALAYMSDSGPVYAGPTALEREAATEIEALEEECRLSMGVIAFERSRAERAEAALADRDAKIAELRKRVEEAEDEADLCNEAALACLARSETAEAQVAELTQKLERATALVAKFVRCNDEGPGLIDCIDNDGERYTSQFLADTVREARALNSGASQNG